MEVTGETSEMLALHPAARRPFEKWLALSVTWRGFHDIRQVRADVDRVGSCYVFNIGGNKFRLITKIEFETPRQKGAIHIRHLMTHEEYERGAWKGDC